MTVDTSAWSGEGEFTTALIEALKGVPGIDLIRVEDEAADLLKEIYSYQPPKDLPRWVERE